MKKQKILALLKKNAGKLRSEFYVDKLFLFGSTARNETKARSDVDLLVEFSSKEVGIFEFVQLKEFLENILQTKVDLVTRDAVKDWMLASIEKESIRAA